MQKCYVIPTQKKCNNDCVFCVTKCRSYNSQKEFLEVNDEFLSNIEYVKSLGIKKFEITGGGEPTLNSNLKNIIGTIRNIIPDAFIKLYTNGNLLLDLKGIDELNISSVHYDKEINDLFMRPKSRTLDIYTILKYYRSTLDENTKIRLSIPLIKGAVDTINKLDNFICSTSSYVDSYVVRTLYPETKNKNDLYIDFDYNKEKVIIERENTSLFNGYVLWSDGKIYNNFSLETEVIKKDFSYLIVKPDAIRIIDDIMVSIKNENFNIIGSYIFKNFYPDTVYLYRDKKDSGYYKEILMHLEYLSYLFGNEAILLLLSNEKKFEDLIKDIYLLKQYLRGNFSFTYKHQGRISVQNSLLDFNAVHAPDTDTSFVLDDLNYIRRLGVITSNNEISLKRSL